MTKTMKPGSRLAGGRPAVGKGSRMGNRGRAAAAAFLGLVSCLDAAVHEMFPREGMLGTAPYVVVPGSAVIRSRVVPQALRLTLPSVSEQAAYPFFTDAAYTTTVTRVSRGFDGADIVEGASADASVKSLTIYTPGGIRHEVYGTADGLVYIAASLPDGTMRMQAFDPSLEPGHCGNDDHGHLHARRRHRAEETPPGETETAPQAAASLTAFAAGDTEIDLMMVFDTGAAAWANSSAGGVAAMANSAVARMNTALEDSGIACVVRLVGTYLPSYAYKGNLGAALDDVTYGDNGLGGVAAQRDACGADVVSFMVDTGSASGVTGIGLPIASASQAFSACAVRSVNISHTMTHEIGHNFGCGHSQTLYGGAGAYRAFPYAAGLNFTGNNSTRYHTIMAYYYDDASRSYTPCNLFSSPLLTFQGVPAGNAATADNARCIRERMAVLAAFRSPVVPPALSVAPASQPVPHNAGTAMFSVTNTGSGAMAWTAAVTSGGSWARITSGAGGDGTGAVTVSYDTNPIGGTARAATIRVTAAGADGSPADVTVNQAANPVSAELEAIPSSLDFSAAAASQTLYVSANVPWSAAGNADWISVSPASGSGNEIVTVTVAANTATVARDTTVTLSGGGLTRTATVTQAGVGAWTYDGAGLLAHSNTGWTLTVSASGNGLAVTGIGTAPPAPSALPLGDTVNGGYRITAIGHHAFEGCGSLTGAPAIPGSVGSIGHRAFSDCRGLTGATLGSGVTNIGGSAFANCPRMEYALLEGAAPATGSGVFPADSLQIYVRDAHAAGWPLSGGTFSGGDARWQGNPVAILGAETHALARTAILDETELAGCAGSKQGRAMAVPAKAAYLRFAISGGTGDCDLYVRRGAPPTTSEYDHRPNLIGNNEQVIISNPETDDWHIMLHGATAYSGVTLTVGYGTPATLAVSPATLTLGDGADSQTFTVTGNVPWIVATGDTDWLTASPASGLSNGTVTVTATVNPGAAPRDATVTVTGGSLTRDVTVTQAGATVLHTVTTASSPPSGGTTAGGGPTGSGAPCTVTATANSGYTFARWTEGGAAASADAAYTFTVTRARALTAVFTPNPYTVTFDAHGGSVAPPSRQVTFATAYGPLPKPTLAGWHFAGWWTDASGGTQVTAASIHTTPSPVTLHARWADAPPAYLTDLDDFAGADTAPIATTAYEGFVYDADGTVLGTLTLSAKATAKKATKTAPATTNWSATAKALLQAGSVSFTAKAAPALDALAFTTKTAGAALTGLTLGADTFSGTLTSGTNTYGIAGARNAFTDTKKDDAARLRLDKVLGYYTAALADDTGMPAGYLTLTVAAKGSVKLAGKLADGTSVSGSARLIEGLNADRWHAIALHRPLYSKKGAIAGLLWLSPDDKVLRADTANGWHIDWTCGDAAKSPTQAPFTRRLDVCGGYFGTGKAPAAPLAADYLFSALIPTADLPAPVAGLTDAGWKTEAYPDGLPVRVTGAKLAIDKGAAPKKDKETGLYDYSATNTATATISYTAKAGIFKGSFKLYYAGDGARGFQHKAVSISYAGVLTPVRDEAHTLAAWPIGIGAGPAKIGKKKTGIGVVLE